MVTKMHKLTRRDVLLVGALLGTGAYTCRLSLAADAGAYKPAVSDRPVPGASGFGFESTAEEVTAGMDLSGMTALITGCNSGIGYETMRVLAMRGAHIYGAGRTAAKAEAACDSVDGKTTPIVIELTEFETVVAAADEMRSIGVPLDMLILNAGVMAIQQLEQVYGLEKQFVVNHLGHFLLTEHLLDSVAKAPNGRVVSVSSWAHHWAPEEGIQFDNLSGERGYDPWQAYGQSKLANGLFARELARKLADTNATANSLHPGVIDTNLDRHLPPRDEAADDVTSDFTWKTIPQGAATTCYVATNPDLGRVTGYYFSDNNIAMPTDHMQDDAMAERLWQVSMELTSDYRLET